MVVIKRVISLVVFLLVVNALSLGLVDWLSDSLWIDGFGWTLLAALVISAVSWALDSLLGDT